MKLGIIIIDDERDAIEAIENSLKFCKISHTILGTTTNPLEGAGLILKHKPDVVFLDIEMPELTGFELLESIPSINFEVVFATAYEHYALRAIKNNAADYILKPISVSKVSEALLKVSQRLAYENKYRVDYHKLISEAQNDDNKKLMLNSKSGFIIVNIDDIISIKAHSVYSEIRLNNNKSILVTKSLKDVEQKIESDYFFRSHKSYLINLHFVKGYNSEKSLIIMSDESTIKLARRRRDEFKSILQNIINE